MRILLLVSTLLLTPTLAFSAPTCAIPQTAADTTPPSNSAASEFSSLTPIGPDRVERIPALRRIVSKGAELFDLGAQHGLQTVFARNGSTFQVFYLTPDGQAAVGGVMWDAAGHNITRTQVAPIHGTIPTVTIDAPTTATVSAATSQQTAARPPKSALKAAANTIFGTVGSATAPRLYMFIDPLCSFSVRAVDQLRPYIAAGKLQLAVIPVTVLDGEDQGQSTIAAKGLLSLPPDQIVTAWQNQRIAPLPPALSDATARLAQNMAAAETLMLRGTPTFVWHKADGTDGQAVGIPDNIEALVASMGS